MDSTWKKLENEFNVSFNESERRRITSSVVLDFVHKDLRYWEIDEKTFVNNPEGFREALLREAAERHIRRKYEPDIDYTSKRGDKLK